MFPQFFKLWKRFTSLGVKWSEANHKMSTAITCYEYKENSNTQNCKFSQFLCFSMPLSVPLFLPFINLSLSPWVNFINILLGTFLPIFWHQKISKPNVIRETLLNSLSYKKRSQKMLMKLTPGTSTFSGYLSVSPICILVLFEFSLICLDGLYVFMLIFIFVSLFTVCMSPYILMQYPFIIDLIFLLFISVSCFSLLCLF